MYSDIINSAKLNPEYSIKKPDDNSASDSETSKGTYLISVNITTQNKTKPSNKGSAVIMLLCSNTIDRKESDCVYIQGSKKTSPIVMP